MDDSEVISFLLQTEIIPLCLRIMETGSQLSKTVSMFSSITCDAYEAHMTFATMCMPCRVLTYLCSVVLCWCQVSTFIIQKILLDDMGLK